ncbi:MAG: GntR family transcriptional regulator, partial [Tabrizicola sp.]|nr:GntR family transcriptional regulator [Tabrizicola sp.]
MIFGLDEAMTTAAPLYQRIAADLIARIGVGELAPGRMLPSEAEVGAEYGASQGTARKALGVTDLDNVTVRRMRPARVLPPITYVWQVELRPGSGIFEDVIIESGLGNQRALGPTITITPDL